jgi:hypothetical protein
MRRLKRCAGLPDGRAANRHFTMEDIGMAGLPVFFMQSPSFLAHQEGTIGRAWQAKRTHFAIGPYHGSGPVVRQIDLSLVHPIRYD